MRIRGIKILKNISQDYQTLKNYRWFYFRVKLLRFAKRNVSGHKLLTVTIVRSVLIWPHGDEVYRKIK